MYSKLFHDTFREPLNRFLDRLDSEFQNNSTLYKDLSKLNEDESFREVYAYITVKRYNNSTVGMLLNAFATTYELMVVIQNSGIDVANFENIFHLFKNADHLNLMEPSERNVTNNIR